MRSSRAGIPSCIAIGIPLLTAFWATPCAGQVDYLLHRVAEADGTLPVVLRLPRLGDDLSGPNGGLRPLLYRMAERDPVFRRAYFGFLCYLDEMNGRLERMGGGRYRLSADIPRMEDYARAIEAMGGMSKMRVRSNQLGVTWDSLLEEARGLAERSLQEEGLDLDASERALLSGLLALAQIAAVSNRVLPQAYLAEWGNRHAGRPPLPEARPEAIPARMWERVRRTVPWMHHAGALPWPEIETENPHVAYDVLHFFTHAWIVNYSLYQHRFPRTRGGDGPARSGVDERTVMGLLARARLISIGYELFSTVVDDFGFKDITPTEFLPAAVQPLCRCLGIKGFPIIEAMRDLRTDAAGATYGAALAVSALPLKPSETRGHALVLIRFFALNRFGRPSEWFGRP